MIRVGRHVCIITRTKRLEKCGILTDASFNAWYKFRSLHHDGDISMKFRKLIPDLHGYHPFLPGGGPGHRKFYVPAEERPVPPARTHPRRREEESDSRPFRNSRQFFGRTFSCIPFPPSKGYRSRNPWFQVTALWPSVPISGNVLSRIRC